jgi:hypothetical protein
MPVFFQWEWQENTQTFLLIFHFDADGSKPNLRKQEMTFSDFKGMHTAFIYLPLDFQASEEFKASTMDSKRRSVITWAPSHVEVASMMELLSYANIINGFKKDVRSELRSKLEIGFW